MRIGDAVLYVPQEESSNSAWAYVDRRALDAQKIDLAQCGYETRPVQKERFAATFIDVRIGGHEAVVVGIEGASLKLQFPHLPSAVRVYWDDDDLRKVAS
jgi:hypothetical protein